MVIHRSRLSQTTTKSTKISRAWPVTDFPTNLFAAASGFCYISARKGHHTETPLSPRSALKIAAHVTVFLTRVSITPVRKFTCR